MFSETVYRLSPTRCLTDPLHILPFGRPEVHDLRKYRRDSNLAIPDRHDFKLAIPDRRDQNLAIEKGHDWKNHSDRRDSNTIGTGAT